MNSYWVIDKIISAHIYATIAFLLLSIFNKQIRVKRSFYLNISNLILLCCLFINLGLLVQQTIICKLNQTEFLQNSNTEGYDYYYSRNCYTQLIWYLLLGFAFQLLFIFKKYRIRIKTTILSVFLLLIFTYIEAIIILITSFYNDYLPSSWSRNKDTIWTILFAVSYFTICWGTATFYKKLE